VRSRTLSGAGRALGALPRLAWVVQQTAGMDDGSRWAKPLHILLGKE
jgi:hypothetical protein